MTRITDQKILCVYIHVYQIIKSEDLARTILCIMLIIENIFGSLSNVKSRGSAYILRGKWKKFGDVLAERKVTLS